MKKRKFKPLNANLEIEEGVVHKTQLKYFAEKMITILHRSGGSPLMASKKYYRDKINDWLDMYIDRNKALWIIEELEKKIGVKK